MGSDSDHKTTGLQQADHIHAEFMHCVEAQNELGQAALKSMMGSVAKIGRMPKRERFDESVAPHFGIKRGMRPILPAPFATSHHSGDLRKTGISPLFVVRTMPAFSLHR